MGGSHDEGSSDDVLQPLRARPVRRDAEQVRKRRRPASLPPSALSCSVRPPLLSAASTDSLSTAASDDERPAGLAKSELLMTSFPSPPTRSPTHLTVADPSSSSNMYRPPILSSTFYADSQEAPTAMPPLPYFPVPPSPSQSLRSSVSTRSLGKKAKQRTSMRPLLLPGRASLDLSSPQGPDGPFSPTRKSPVSPLNRSSLYRPVVGQSWEDLLPPRLEDMKSPNALAFDESIEASPSMMLLTDFSSRPLPPLPVLQEESPQLLHSPRMSRMMAPPSPATSYRSSMVGTPEFSSPTLEFIPAPKFPPPQAPLPIPPASMPSAERYHLTRSPASLSPAMGSMRRSPRMVQEERRTLDAPLMGINGGSRGNSEESLADPSLQALREPAPPAEKEKGTKPGMMRRIARGALKQRMKQTDDEYRSSMERFDEDLATTPGPSSPPAPTHEDAPAEEQRHQTHERTLSVNSDGQVDFGSLLASLVPTSSPQKRRRTEEQKLSVDGIDLAASLGQAARKDGIFELLEGSEEQEQEEINWEGQLERRDSEASQMERRGSEASSWSGSHGSELRCRNCDHRLSTSEHAPSRRSSFLSGGGGSEHSGHSAARASFTESPVNSTSTISTAAFTPRSPSTTRSSRGSSTSSLNTIATSVDGIVAQRRRSSLKGLGLGLIQVYRHSQVLDESVAELDLHSLGAGPESRRGSAASDTEPVQHDAPKPQAKKLLLVERHFSSGPAEEIKKTGGLPRLGSRTSSSGSSGASKIKAPTSRRISSTAWSTLGEAEPTLSPTSPAPVSAPVEAPKAPAKSRMPAPSRLARPSLSSLNSGSASSNDSARRLTPSPVLRKGGLSPSTSPEPAPRRPSTDSLHAPDSPEGKRMPRVSTPHPSPSPAARKLRSSASVSSLKQAARISYGGVKTRHSMVEDVVPPSPSLPAFTQPVAPPSPLPPSPTPPPVVQTRKSISNLPRLRPSGIARATSGR